MISETKNPNRHDLAHVIWNDVTSKTTPRSDGILSFFLGRQFVKCFFLQYTTGPFGIIDKVTNDKVISANS